MLSEGFLLVCIGFSLLPWGQLYCPSACKRILLVIADIVVDLSRIQFAFTALFHFLFVPLTLGLTWILVVMEAAYLRTGQIVYKDMTQFWGKLLAINFALGVVTGITMEFEFGQNWAYFSRMIGGSFGPVLAIEGITAFMLEATMFGLFFFGWDKMSRLGHFVVTCLMAFGASLSIVNILAANSWMQQPEMTSFQYLNMSLEMHSIARLYMNMLAQVRIAHVAFAGFLTASIFVMGISAFYLLKGRDIGFAKRSFAVGAGFGLVCALSVAFFGDQNGLQVSQHEPEKMAAIEAQWHTQQAPAAWYLIAFPNQAERKNYFTLSIPYALSLIATHSLSGTVEGVSELVDRYRERVKSGMLAYGAMEKLMEHKATAEDRAVYEAHQKDLGFGLLLKHYAPAVVNATPEQIDRTAYDGIPQVNVAFWSFRVMLGLWTICLLLILIGLVYLRRDILEERRWYLRLVLYAIPLPYLAAESGWILAEVGRQPWAVHEILPTFMGTSSLSFAALLGSLSGFVVLYGGLLILELFLMFKYARLGPSSLHQGRYHHERLTASGGESHV